MADVYTFIERSKILLAQKRTADAVKQIQQALAIAPDNDEALAILARCKFDVNEYQQGIDILITTLQIDANNSYYYYLLGFGYYKINNHTKAIEWLQNAISIDPFFTESFGLLAYIFLHTLAFEKALNKANEGLAIDAENITCLNARSIALNKLKRIDEATETMQDALAKDPDNEYTHATVGWNYVEKGKHKLATNHFREALRLNPNYANAATGLKEALKSKIPLYRWLLQYSYWLNNQSKNTRWILPVSLYIAVRIIATVSKGNSVLAKAGLAIVGIYLFFVITSWVINPVANFFLLFNKDGKHALNSTEKYTSITVISTLFIGILFVLIATFLVAKNNTSPYFLTGILFLALSLPLGNITYPISFKKYGTQNKVALILSTVGMLTIVFLYTYNPVAIVLGFIFLLGLIINSWTGIFRR
jgi:tetratricopeptide (TPR) repeat protein